MLYRILRLIGQLICKVLFRLKVKGVENIPAKGRIIIAANHSSYLDPIAVGVAVPRRISWVVRKDVFDVWWLKWLFTLTGMIRENGSVDKAVSLLEKGEAVGMFPEGGRSFDGKLGKGKKGVAIMALKTGTAVVPCAVLGAFKAFPLSAMLPKPYPVRIAIGKAIRFQKIDMPDEEAIDSALNKIMTAINSLLDG